MADQFGIPTLAELQQYNVNRPDQIEAIKQSLYDTQIYVAAGQTQLIYFQVPKGGAGGKTFQETNMTGAGALPSPQSFLVQTIEIFFFPLLSPGTFGAGAAANFINDIYAVAKSGWLEFFVGSKPYLDEAPLVKFPPRCGLSGFAAAADSTTAGANQHTLIQYASWGGPVYELVPPILLVPTQNFQLTLNWPVALPLPSGVNATTLVNFGGILYRNSQ